MSDDEIDIGKPEFAWARGLTAVEISVIMALGDMLIGKATKKLGREVPTERTLS